MLLSIPHSPSPHSLFSKTLLNLSPSSLPTSSSLRHQNHKPYTPHRRSSPQQSADQSAGQSAGQSAIQRISDKLRNLGYLPENPASPLPPTGPGSPGEIFIPTPRDIPKHRVGYTIDPSWSTPEHPVPEPGSGGTAARFHELWERGREGARPEGRDAKVPTVAELMLPRKELKRLTALGIGLTKQIKVGKAGITEGIVNGVHERWRRSEVVKIRCEDISRMNMKRTHEILERKTGGLVVWRTGNVLVLYRGANYKYPYFDSTECEMENVDEDCSDTIVDSVVNDFAANTSIASRGSRVHTPLVARGDWMENFNEVNSGPTMENVAEKEPTIAENSSTELSSTRGRFPFVTGVGSPNKLRLQFPGEARLSEEADKLLEGLGPRFTDWWGEDPLPVDGDSLPPIVPRFRKSFRLLPFGLKPQLTDRECTVLRRLSRHIPCHFALGRNRNHQGLAVSIIKLWERCEVAKIAVKRGAQNTNSQIMAEELKSLTGGTILSRDKYFIVLYRGKDFLPPAVSIAIEERRNWNSHHRVTSKDDASLSVSNFSSTMSLTKSSDVELKETAEEEKSLMVLRNAKSANSAVRKVEAMLTQANQKIEKTEKHLAELEKAIELVPVESDKEGISEEERYMLRRVGLNMKPFLLLGRRGVFDGTIENMHLHWKYRELVKIIFNNRYFENVESIARTLESESGGILVAIERVSKGYAVVIYRGKNYQRPANLRPRTLLNKKEALKRSLEAQRYESLKLHALRLEKTIDQLDSKSAGNDSKTSTVLLTELEGANSSNETTDKIEPIEIEDDSGSESEIETNRSVESDFNGENFEKMIVLEHQQGHHATEISEHSLLSTRSILMSCRGESIADDEILLADTVLRDNVSNPTISGDACASEKPSVNLSTGEAQTLSGSSSSGSSSSWKHESDVEVNFRPDPLSNRERLLLRKQALNMRKRPVLAVGRSNILTGVTKTIKTHFKKYPLAIVNIKGIAKGTSVHELIFELEQATGSILVSREPNKIILYRGWGERELPGGVKDNMEVNQAAVSDQLVEAIRRECGLPSAEAQ